jgi:phage tail-like protein
MPRSQSTDPFQTFRFHVTATKAGGNGIDPFGPVAAGFMSVSLPTINVESVEYKEGTMVYRRKFPGDVTFDDITLTRGVVSKGSELWNWINECARGKEYRIDLEIKHFHRQDIVDKDDFTTLTPSRVIKCFNCFPISVKPGSDLDAQSSEVSVQEITLSIERFEVENKVA